MRRAIHSLALLLLTACSASSPVSFTGSVPPIEARPDTRSPRALVEAAEASLLSGNYEAALALYESALDRASSQATLWPGGIRAFEGIERLRRVYPSAHDAMVRRKATLDRQFEGAHVFEAPVDFRSLSSLIHLNRLLDHPADALALYDRVTAAPPGLASLYREMMYADVLPELYRRERFDTIVAEFPRMAAALAHDPAHAEQASLLLAAALIREGLDREASTFCGEVLARRRDSPLCTELRNRLTAEHVDASLFFLRPPCRDAD